MKTRSLPLVLTVAMLLATILPVQARQPSPYDDYSADAMAIDAVIARPLCLVATVVGAGLFVATLPITLISRSTDKAAKALVATPAHYTFTRKLGKLSEIE